MQPIPVNGARSRFWLVVCVCLALLALPQLATAGPKKKIDVCHIPPDDPSNFHTISINPSALPAHLAHGDIEGPCGQACTGLCDDGNVCTIDDCFEGTLICIAEADKETVDCDDGNPATVDFCDAGSGGCENVPRVTAESQSVSTIGTQPLVVTLRGNSVEGKSLAFSVGQPSAGTLGPVTPVTSAGMCSETGDTCTDDAGCPAGEFCALPPVTSATVTYTPNTPDNVEDSFDFAAALEAEPSIFADATVTINPFDPSPPPDVPVDTVVARDVFAETALEIARVVRLAAEAPCEEACDGVGEDTPLTFSILNDPASGTLSALTQGAEVPQRTATVTYTPAALFTGTDSFVFEACGVIGGLEVCDSGTATVVTAPSRPLVTDQAITTQNGLPVNIDIGKVQAVVLQGAQIAGNVADADGDFIGDNHNDLPGAAPVLMAAAANATGGPGSNGMLRMQIEWDISGLQNFGNKLDELVSAEVVLNTQIGSVDSEDTQFFVGDPEALNEDGLLTDDDFQTPVLSSPVATMPVPDSEPGTQGIFTFEVLEGLKAAVAQGRTFFTVQGRLANEFVPASCSVTTSIFCTVDAQCPAGESCSAPFRRGLQVRTTADGNLAEGLEPQLEITTAGEVSAATFSIAVLPANGVLIDSQGNEITETLAPLPSTRVTYVPNAGFSGTDTFTTQADNGVSIQTGLIQINVVQTCVEVGREPGCAPDANGANQ